MTTHIILGAGGAIADKLTTLLLEQKQQIVLVSRNPKQVAGATSIAADLTDRDDALRAITADSIVYNCVGLKYDYRLWRQAWPKIMDNTIDACARTKSKLIFFDNIYMYGLVNGRMTEETPYNPSSLKGDLRARIATQLMSEVRKGNVTAMIARAADFYGPGADKTGVANLLIFQKLIEGKKPQWIASIEKLHAFTYTEDAARALQLLAQREDAWNQVWHLPTAQAITMEEFIALACQAANRPYQYSLLTPFMMKLAGLFIRNVKESYEMLYQYDHDYIFDSGKFERAFGMQPLSYRQGITETFENYKKM